MFLSLLNLDVALKMIIHSERKACMDLILPILLSGTAVKPESKGSLIFIFN